MAWNEAKKFIFLTDPSKIDADLSNFPILIRLAASATLDAQDLTAIFDELGANGKRIAVFAGGGQTSGTECYVEIEKWDNTGEEAALHVKVPSVDDTSATEIHLYYDNSQPDNTAYVGETTSSAAQNVWDADFCGVYHMAQVPQSGTGYIKDSTSLGLHGNAGNMETGDLQAGLAGGCLAFDGSNEYVRVPYNAAQAPTAALTIEGLAYKDDWQATRNERIQSKTENGGYQLVYGQTAHKVEFALYRNASYGRAYINDDLVTDGWAYFAGTYDGRYAVLRYNEGAIEATDDAGGNYSIGYAYQNSFVIAAEPDSGSGIQGNYFLGKIDEIRLSKIARSAAWLKATYYSLFDQILTVNSSPATPSVTDVDEASQQATFTGSAFSDPDSGDIHYASQWQVDLQTEDFSTPVVDSGEDTTNKTSYTATGLDPETDYKARVRHEDNSGFENAWSSWSAPVNFTTLATSTKPYTPAISVSPIYQTQATLNGSTFQDPGSYEHEASQWQVDEQAGDFSDPVIDSGEDTTHLTQYVATSLTGETDYKARARYKNDSGDPENEWSEWSTPEDFTTKAAWTGIVFSNRTPPDETYQVPDGTAISCDVTDNWYSLAAADIKITVEGTQYTSISPEVSYQTITNGKRITWTPSASYKYGRGNQVDARIDAKNSHADESYTEWQFYGLRFLAGKEARVSFFYKTASLAQAEIGVIYRQAATRATELVELFRRATGMVGAETGAARLLFAVRDQWIGTGQCEPTVFVCEMKRIQGQGSANVAEVELQAGEGSANIHGAYLLVGSGSANVQAFMVFVTSAGSGDIAVTITRLGQGSADIGIPVRSSGEGAADIYKVEGETYFRINALPSVVKEALQAAGVIVDA